MFVVFLGIRYVINNVINKASDAIGNAYSRKKNEEPDVVIRIADEYRDAKWNKGGRIIKRAYTFYDKSYIFSLTDVPFQKLLEEGLKTMNLSDINVICRSNNAKRGATFTAHAWKAQIVQTDNDGDKYRYTFQFTTWKTMYELPTDIKGMNTLLTEIERTMLYLDPEATVVRKRLIMNSKSNFI